MYAFNWNKKNGGYTLTTQTGKYVASEIRPVYAQELRLIGFDEYFTFDKNEKRPLMWAKQNVYIYCGNEVAKLEKTQYGQPLTQNYLVPPCKLKAVDIKAMVKENTAIMDTLVTNTLKRIKEMYDQYMKRYNIAYIGFSGGKDSVALLDLCHRVLPLSVPVIFSDTDMELPDTYIMWEEIQKRYPERMFLKAKANTSALDNWKIFGPPSRTIRWCCSVHKSTPAILLLREILQKPPVNVLAFLGIRGEESLGRAEYDDVCEAVKNSSQTNAHPILSWGAHELYLYLFANDLPINRGYKYGLPRVGCVLCPEAPEKYSWFVNAIYPGIVQPYNHIILNSTVKEFSSKNDGIAYLSTAGWQARRNGLELKSKIHRPQSTIKENNFELTHFEAEWKQFYTWIQTLGQVQTVNENQIRVFCQNSILHDVGEVAMVIERNQERCTSIRGKCESAKACKLFLQYITKCLNKSIACIGCQTCESECPTGALVISRCGVNINAVKCVHCLKCHSADYGCWRFKSMMVPNELDTPLKSIGSYQNFGLRTEWLLKLVESKENFPKTNLGGPMIDSGRLWFKQALLVIDGKSCKPRKILTFAEKFGCENIILWDLIWIALANNSPLIKWFVTSCGIDERKTQDDLSSMIGDIVKNSTKKGGLQALCNLIKSSPIGTGDSPIVQLETKGQRVISLTRVARSVDPLVILYGLYVMVQATEQSSFTISQMMTTDFESKCVSPLIAFGMPVAKFKAFCQGLATKYPEFIYCNFALGMDEIRVKSEDKTLDDVVDLMLKS